MNNALIKTLLNTEISKERLFNLLLAIDEDQQESALLILIGANEVENITIHNIDEYKLIDKKFSKSSDLRDSGISLDESEFSILAVTPNPLKSTVNIRYEYAAIRYTKSETYSEYPTKREPDDTYTFKHKVMLSNSMTLTAKELAEVKY